MPKEHKREPMYCERCVFNSGQHIKNCVAPKGGLFNPHQDVYQQYWGPGGARNQMAKIRIPQANDRQN